MTPEFRLGGGRTGRRGEDNLWDGRYPPPPRVQLGPHQVLDSLPVGETPQTEVVLRLVDEPIPPVPSLPSLL